MKKIWFYVVGLVVILFIVVGIFILLMKNNSMENQDEITTELELIDNQMNIETTKEKEYYVIYEKGVICVYIVPNNELYDYADINVENLPEDIREDLTRGMYIKGEDRLYDFLQSYSS